MKRSLATALILLGALFVPAPAAAALHGGPPPRIVLLGDSITAGGLVAQPDRLGAELAYRLCGTCRVVENDGVGGQQLLGGPNPLVATAPPIIATLQPGDIVIVDIGMNDLFNYPGDQAWTSAYVNLVTSIQATGAHALVGQITPISSAQWPHELLRQQLDQWELDYFGAGLVLQYQQVLHCTRGSCAGQSWMDPRYGWDDGIHVNEGGYAVMADLLASTLRQDGWWS